MKTILLTLIVLSAIALSSCHVASRPSPGEEVLQQQQRRVAELESQLDGLRHHSDRWKLFCAFGSVGAVVLLIFGTALGAKTRHDAFATS